jgi:hypothetical protein
MRTMVESMPTLVMWTSHVLAPKQFKAATLVGRVPVGTMDSVLWMPVLDYKPISPLFFWYMARGNSFTSLGHNADTENKFVPLAVPCSVPTHTSVFQPFGLGHWFFTPHPLGTSSSLGISTALVVSVLDALFALQVYGSAAANLFLDGPIPVHK